MCRYMPGRVHIDLHVTRASTTFFLEVLHVISAAIDLFLAFCKEQKGMDAQPTTLLVSWQILQRRRQPICAGRIRMAVCLVRVIA